ncbi:MAG: alpha/beta hydrolase, partial [Cyclobacteriaceae bacterium]
MLWPELNSEEEETRDSSRGHLWIEKVRNPIIEVFLPSKVNATGHGVVICPGGGYLGLAYDNEGYDIAKWLNSKGIAGFVLKYRIPDVVNDKASTTYPLEDARKAIQIVRQNAEKWNVNTDQIGIMGFSAGGHLASTLSTHYNHGEHGIDQMDEISARPDFMILIYPVITFQIPYAHEGSKEMLLGTNPEKDMID